MSRDPSQGRGFQFEYPLHQLPLGGGGGGGVAALELGHVGLPLGLAGKEGQAGVVGGEVKVVHRVHYHEKAAAQAVDLHVQDAYLADAGLHFRPDMGVGIDILFNQGGIVLQVQGLAIAFHEAFD